MNWHTLLPHEIKSTTKHILIYQISDDHSPESTLIGILKSYFNYNMPFII